MKKLQANGMVIRTPRNYNFSLSGAHDRWGTHAPVAGGIALGTTATGLKVVAAVFTLTDGQIYIYRLTDADVASDVEPYYEAWKDFINPDWLVGYYGQWWNYAGRWDVIEKMTPAQWEQFLSDW
jgi:hypothetical protein